MNPIELIKRHQTFGGWTGFYKHHATSTATVMRFSVYLPPAAERGPCPVVYFLAGLTCTEENFMVKAAAQRAAAELGLILVSPDTSPRGVGIPGEDDSWDFGTGAGFYVDATVAPWSRNYRMYDYCVNELPGLVNANFPVRANRQGIMGHSMGGHGALVIGLRNPTRYRSISAFSPICAPSECPWGEKAFSGYLGTDKKAWREYDATHLVSVATDKARPLLIDQGAADEFLVNQLRPDRLKAACAAADYPLELRMRDGYDHGYYFIETFIDEHLAHHAQALR